jgi:hypothetical protein
MECLSFDPGDWPSPSRPYFMLAVDTSGSMTACTNPTTIYPETCPAGATVNSCGLVPTRYNDAKCALEQTVLAFSGQVNFGLSTFAVELSACPPGCSIQCAPGDTNCNAESYGCNVGCFPSEAACAGCGPGSNATRAGAYIRVPMLQDHFWIDPPDVPNSSALLEWFAAPTGDICNLNRELFAAGATPLNGILRDMKRYFETGWTHPDNPAITFATPLDAQDRGCRDVNVILLTDGDETCDSQAQAEAAAADLFVNGVTVGTNTFNIRTHVINFAGGTPANTNAIAAAGGTTTSLFATNEVALAQALANIVAGAVQPESCNNGDDNCNGCTDEGFKHYCDIGQTCCVWNNQTERDACLASYQASVIASPPDGDLDLLPCTDLVEQATPAEWLCFDPGDICDESDNNCQDGIDEGQLKCGNPPLCPTAETCDGIDNDCNGQTDDGGVCGSCTPSAEVCDGCDNDCDGLTDNNPPVGGFPVLACGLPSPPNLAQCDGTHSCLPPVAVPPGTCSPGAGYGVCNNNPLPEICNGDDDDCDGAIDEGYVSTTCVPTGNPGGLVYTDTFPLSACVLGTMVCVSGAEVCQGGTGPGPELCNGIDDDCNGVVDDGAFGVGQQCGVNTPPCTPGATACVNGAIVCQGGNGPQAEVCDGIDNDCDGAIDDAPLADAAASPGCWTNPGACCSQPNVALPPLEWCPPTGANCTDAGTLVAPCNTGTLVCNGGAGWICQGPVGPNPEVCDGLDNDCNGGIDDGGPLPLEGQVCGIATPPCMAGLTACVAGTIDCVGDVGPSQEVCDAVDNDCDGMVDENIPNMGTCNVSFDMMLFPNSNSANLPCQPGLLECNPVTGMFECQGGVGPLAEVCDGIDNDCDTSIDEAGAAPDGIDGSANPFPPPAANIGDMCGLAAGACDPGNYACLSGIFACLGGQGPVTETCDCEDNDCDGISDEPPGMGEPVLCSPGKDCIKAADFCQCAEICSGGEYPCPPGQICEVVEIQGMPGTFGQYCVTDFEAQCGKCEEKTVEDGNQVVVCAPAGTDPPGCFNTPVCDCKGESGCREPCFNVQCAMGEVCSNFGPTPGTCVADICYNTGCPGCDKACSGGLCVDNPCTAGSCAATETAKPNFATSVCDCIPSCADVNCPSAQQCVEGVCVDWCDPECTGGQVCDPATQTCIDSLCTPASCPDGSYCDPLTGMCGDEPCSGVVCPDGQACENGDCFDDRTSTTSGAGGGGGSSSAGGAAPTGTTGSGNNQNDGVFGLPTGGGGCGCKVAGGALLTDNGDTERKLGWLLLGLGVMFAARRRRTTSLGGAR